MILTTTETVEGKLIAGYCGIIGTEVIFGANFLKDWISDGTDFWGGRNGVYEEVYEDARAKALQEIRSKARSAGADAVVSVRLSYQVMGEKNGMMMVAAVGTGVRLTLTKEERAELLAAQEKSALKDSPEYMVSVGEKVRGPFSIDQLAALVASGRVDRNAVTTSETSESGRSVAELLAI